MSLEGSKAPDFSLAGSDGKTHDLKQYAGKTVINEVIASVRPRSHSATVRTRDCGTGVPALPSASGPGHAFDTICPRR